ncbi:hypothetical protein M378DRAFT_276494 [Amanita muscaria Koide BX008]|uniref:Secreted protein n=1 Tax=Amanita muscaria (strain Koide BX008) TaxID=946122 RepID=A0A0C2WS68_AMAMK|nr:hypothetical protein M378DRAFT_276494 [Amanita muscaria Koide BX008]
MLFLFHFGLFCLVRRCAVSCSSSASTNALICASIRSSSAFRALMYSSSCLRNSCELGIMVVSRDVSLSRAALSQACSVLTAER